MKLALLQLSANSDKNANLLQAQTMSKEALEAQAKFVLLPEVFNFRGDLRNKEVLRTAAEKIPGPSSVPFITLAQKYKATILLGSIIEKANSTYAHNTSVLINPRGEITAKYRKIHLFDAAIGDRIVREADCFRAGKRLVKAKMDEFTVGLSVCYDLRFADLYQRYANHGAQVLTVPSCFTRKTGEAHWEVLLRARAIENLAYVLAPNQVGTDLRGLKAHGHSMIISPWGEIVAQAGGEDPEIVYGEIKMEEVLRARKVLPGIIRRK